MSESDAPFGWFDPEWVRVETTVFNSDGSVTRSAGWVRREEWLRNDGNPAPTAEHVHLYTIDVSGEDPDFVTTWSCHCGQIVSKDGLPASPEGDALTITSGDLSADDC